MRRPSRAAFLGLLVAVPLVDALSLTRAGKNTANAGILARPELVSKLVVFVPLNKRPLPVIGVGDICYLALITAFASKTGAVLTFAAAMLAGGALNCMGAAVLRRKENYRGFPGTTGPAIAAAAFFAILRFM